LINYHQYLQLEKILSAQQVQSTPAEHDEHLFIVIHQVYELWFKQVLHESAFLMEGLDQGDFYRCQSTLKRMLTILKTMVSQTDVMETMTPISFASFRDRLTTASGFQSWQFRMFEFLLGNKNPKRIAMYPEGSAERQELEHLLRKPTIYDCFLRFLKGRDFPVPQEILGRNLAEPYELHPGVEDVIVEIYRRDEGLTQLCEHLVDLDEGIQEWRYRHVKMVERTIGTKVGTGGSSGAEFLKSTLFKPVFPELWSARSRF
jgi:tryptophan 2,3-dioxygenase